MTDKEIATCEPDHEIQQQYVREKLLAIGKAAEDIFVGSYDLNGEPGITPEKARHIAEVLHGVAVDADDKTEEECK